MGRQGHSLIPWLELGRSHQHLGAFDVCLGRERDRHATGANGVVMVRRERAPAQSGLPILLAHHTGYPIAQGERAHGVARRLEVPAGFNGVVLPIEGVLAGGLTALSVDPVALAHLDVADAIGVARWQATEGERKRAAFETEGDRLGNQRRAVGLHLDCHIKAIGRIGFGRIGGVCPSGQSHQGHQHHKDLSQFTHRSSLNLLVYTLRATSSCAKRKRRYARAYRRLP